MSSYAKNKLQSFQSLNISVDVAKCVENLTNWTLIFVRNKKWLVLTEQSINGKV